MNQLMLQYTYLQLLDFMTTVAFLVIGVQEGNPIVRFMLQASPHPIGGLLAIKAAAVMLGVYCWRMGRERLLQRMTFLFALVVVWNVVAIILGTLN